MEVIGVTSARPPAVTRFNGSVLLVIEGIRDAKVRDRETRLRITLPLLRATELRGLLDRVLSDEGHAAT